MEHLFLTGTLWPKEASNKSCEDKIIYSDVTNQQECQLKCGRQSTCIGILYSYKTGFENYCAVCPSDNLTAWGNEFGFYRRPSGKDRSYI